MCWPFLPTKHFVLSSKNETTIVPLIVSQKHPRKYLWCEEKEMSETLQLLFNRKSWKHCRGVLSQSGVSLAEQVWPVGRNCQSGQSGQSGILAVWSVWQSGDGDTESHDLSVWQRSQSGKPLDWEKSEDSTTANLRNFHYPFGGSKTPHFSLFQALWPPGPF